MIENSSIKKILNSVMEKRQIKELEVEFIEERIKKICNKNQELVRKIDFEKLKLEKDKNFKKLIKKVREDIGILYGSFLTSNFQKKERMINQVEEFQNYLLLHKSTRERIEFYSEIYSKIFVWYKPKKIADLACGLNPCSYEIIIDKLPEVNFFASDLNPKDMEFVNAFFSNNKINGIAKPHDITNLKFLNDKEFVDCDLLFLFKALDSFEHIQRNISKEILEKVPMKKIVVSFPKKSLVAGSDFDLKKRSWLFKFLEKMKWKHETFEIENELFILVSK